MKVRVYGPSIGNGSFARVTAGMREGLAAHGALAGFMPLDIDYDDDLAYPQEGYDAGVAVCAGAPHRAGAMFRFGQHKERLQLVSPNSTWLPYGLEDTLERCGVTGIVTPSQWGKKMVERHFARLPVEVWQHGVSPAPPAPPSAPAPPGDRRDPIKRFVVLHLSSSSMERKGTAELVEAWCHLVARGYLRKPAEPPMLVLVLEAGERAVADRAEKAAGGSEEVLKTIVWSPRLNWPPERMVQAYREACVVCQPSRGEAFGMCSLEALAVGVPVVSTRCTGVSEYWNKYRERQLGCVGVRTGPLAPIDDGPGARAPSLRSDDVAEALIDMFTNYTLFAERAARMQEIVQRDWSWAAATGRWLAARVAR